MNKVRSSLICEMFRRSICLGCRPMPALMGDDPPRKTRRAALPRGIHGKGDREWIGTSLLQLGIEVPRAGRVPEPRDQELAVEQELFGQFAVEVEFHLLD